MTRSNRCPVGKSVPPAKSVDAFVPLSLRGEISNTPCGQATQSWTLDSQGNWSSYTSNGVTQTQTANAQNQITSVSGTSATPTYDASGNTVSMGLTTQPAGSVSTLVYDAWNRLVALKNSSGQIITQYTYNAMGYRITESYPLGGTGIPAGEINYIYYDSQWQAIEARTNGTANSDVTSQIVWSAAYINAAILQDAYSAGVIQSGARIYFLQDANWNTTAIVGLVSGNWQVVQRYVYSPYGTITVLNADWSTPPAGTQPMVDNLYQGMTLDPVTGLYYARNRNYSPSLGRWINQDPAGYPGAAAQARPLAPAGFRGIEKAFSAGERRSLPLNINGANTYQFVESNPVAAVDPWGLYSSSPIPGTPYRGVWGYEDGAPTHYHVVGPDGGKPLATERLDGAEHDGQTLENSGIPKRYWAPIRAWAKKKWEKQKSANRRGGPPEAKPPTPKGGRQGPCPLQNNPPPNMKPFALPQIELPGMPPPWEPPLDPQWQQQMDSPLQDPGFMQPQSAPGIPGYFQGPNNGMYEWPGGEESPLPPPPSVQFWTGEDLGVGPVVEE